MVRGGKIVILLRGKKYFRIVILNLILIVSISLILTNEIDNRMEYNTKKIQKQLIKDISVINEFSSEKIEINKILNDEEADSFLQKVKNIQIAKSGFITRGVTFIKPFLIVLTVVILIYSINVILIFQEQKRYLREIDKYVDSLQKYSFDYSLYEKDESIISKLNSRFNKLGRSIKSDYEKLGFENEKIKDIMVDISHQIKTPLAAISMYNEILKDSKNLSEDEKEFLEYEEKQIMRLRWLIDSLLKLSKFDSNIIKMNPATFKISELSYNIEKVLMENIKKKNLRLKFSGDLDKKVFLDFNWTREALLNVVKNATEHAFESTEIEIKYFVNVAMIKIEVRNVGNIIGEEEITKIFNRFYKSSNNTNSDSVGIGLNLSKKIIENQSGIIYVENVSNGVSVNILFMK